MSVAIDRELLAEQAQSRVPLRKSIVSPTIPPLPVRHQGCIG
jgi:hypothetical protein